MRVRIASRIVPAPTPSGFSVRARDVEGVTGGRTCCGARPWSFVVTLKTESLLHRSRSSGTVALGAATHGKRAGERAARPGRAAVAVCRDAVRAQARSQRPAGDRLRRG